MFCHGLNKLKKLGVAAVFSHYLSLSLALLVWNNNSMLVCPLHNNFSPHTLAHATVLRYAGFFFTFFFVLFRWRHKRYEMDTENSIWIREKKEHISGYNRHKIWWDNAMKWFARASEYFARVCVCIIYIC